MKLLISLIVLYCSSAVAQYSPQCVQKDATYYCSLYYVSPVETCDGGEQHIYTLPFSTLSPYGQTIWFTGIVTRIWGAQELNGGHLIAVVFHQNNTYTELGAVYDGQIQHHNVLPPPGVPMKPTDYLAIYGQCKDYTSSPNPNPHYIGGQRQWETQLYWTY